MTENENSPENLRKFLESDDPAMVRMGISLAKGAGVEATIKDLEHFLKNDNIETIKTGIMLADEAGIGDEAMEMLFEPLKDDDEQVRRSAASELGKIGDKRAVDQLIKTLGIPGETGYGNSEAVWALGEIGDARAVGPLINELHWGGELLDDDDTEASHCKAVPSALVLIGESMRAQGLSADREEIESLIGALDDESWWLPLLTAESLKGIGWKPETDEQKAAYLVASHDWEGCIQMGEHVIEKAVGYLASLFHRRGIPGDWSYGSEIKWSLVKDFGEVAVMPLINVFDGDDVEACMYAAHALGELGDPRAVEPLIKALGDYEDEGGDYLRPYVWDEAKKALKKLGHEVE